jgi:adenine-specific DNA-methyltransferase
MSINGTIAPELLWDGKRKEEAERARSPLPLLGLESFQSGGRAEEGWRNQLILGDNLLVMDALLETHSGKFDLIYIDPPFATGGDFSIAKRIGASKTGRHEELAYRDKWSGGMGVFLSMMHERLRLIHSLLGPDGLLYLHCDWRTSAHLRLLLDELFGPRQLVNEIIWRYRTFQGQTHRHFARKHDTLFLYARGERFTYNEQFGTKIEDTIDGKRWAAYIDRKGCIRGGRMPVQDSRFRRYLDKWVRQNGRQPGPTDIVFQVKGQPVDSVWDLKGLDPKSAERTGYPTQKPLALLQRILRSSTKPGDLVADFFCGSGSSLVSAELEGRRWIGCDMGLHAVQTTRKRLLGIDGCGPFDVIHLGQSERSQWRRRAFSREDNSRDFLLKGYGGCRVEGHAHLHGEKDEAMIHIADPSPLDPAELGDAVAECRHLNRSALHVLAWDWGCGTAQRLRTQAKEQGIRLTLVQLPREAMDTQTAEAGNLPFRELPQLNAVVEQTASCTVRVRLLGLHYPDGCFIPEKLRGQVEDWSEYIDAWAVDWRHSAERFSLDWTAGRTRRNPALPLSSAEHRYPTQDRYRIAVQIVDIFGHRSLHFFESEEE